MNNFVVYLNMYNYMHYNIKPALAALGSIEVWETETVSFELIALMFYKLVSHVCTGDLKQCFL